MTRTRRSWLLVAVFVAASFAMPPPPRVDADEGRPNIVVVMLDDLAAGPAERLFSRLPHIKDRFLDRGIRFTRAYGETPLCCPGRAGFLSGRHTHNHGVTQNHPAGFDQSMTVATALHDAGYWTMWIGKYFNRSDQLELPPPGWDRFENRQPPEYSKLEWIARNAPVLLAEAPTESPVFAVIASPAPHNSTGSYLPGSAGVYSGDVRCGGIGRWAPASYNEADVSDKPRYTRKLPLLPYAKGWPLRRHCEQLLWVDETVGLVEDELARQGRLENTLWILMSDNGMTYGEHRWPFKLSPYATQLPLWASWPAGRPGQPRHEDALVSNIDLGPTLAAIGGGTMPWADGIDWSPLLRDEPFVMPRESILLSLPDGLPTPGMGMPPVPPWWGVRSADGWLYTEWATGEVELYDLVADPWMLQNRARDPSFNGSRQKMARHLETQRPAP